MTGHKRHSTVLDTGSESSAKKCKLTKATFNKWQHEHEKNHLSRSWLRCELQQDKRHIASIHCKICKKYKTSLESMKNFSRAWMTRSTNLEVSNVLEHASIEVHKVAMTQLHADAARAWEESQTPIGHTLSTMDEGTQGQVGWKFDIAYVVAKEASLLPGIPR